MKFKIILEKQYNKIANIGDSLSSIGKEAFRTSNITYKRLFQKSLSRYLKGKKIETKVDILIDLINKSKNIEIVRKSVAGYNVAKVLQGMTGSGTIAIKNIAFIARFDEAIDGTSFEENSIILTTNMIRKNIDNQEVIYFELAGIEVVRLQSENYTHPKIIKINGIEVMDFSSVKKARKLEMTNYNFSKISNLESGINFYIDKGGDSLRLKENKDVFEHLNKFLETKLRDIKKLYFLDEGVDEKTLDDGKKATFYSYINKGYEFNATDKKDRFTFALDSDSNSKMRVIVEKSEIVDLSELFKNKLSDYKLSIQNKKESIKKSDKEIVGWNTEMNKLSQDLEDNKIILEKKKNIGDEVKVEFDQVQKLLNKIKDERKKFEGEASKLNINEKTIKKPKKSKKTNAKSKAKFNEIYAAYEASVKLEKSRIAENKKKIKELKDEIAKCKNKEASLNKSKLNIEKRLNEIRGEIDTEKKFIKEINKKLGKLVANKRTEERKIIGFKSTIAKIKANAVKLRNSFDEINANNLELHKIVLVGAYSDRDKNYKKSLPLEVSPIMDLLLKNASKMSMSDFDPGLRAVVKRSFHALNDYYRGTFKSPYAAISMDKPDVEINVKNISVENIDFNTKQKRALDASAAAHFASFLQGPPGTGKTQVISASIFNAVSMGENVVLSSYANEAIDNAFDRINEHNTNPNLILLRYSKAQKHREKNFKFTDMAIYTNFLKNIGKFVANSSNGNSGSVDELEKILENDRFKSIYVVKDFSKILENNLNDTGFLNEVRKLYKIDAEDDYLYDDIKNQLETNRRKAVRSFKTETELVDKFIKENNKMQFSLNTTWEKYLESFSISSNDSNFSSMVKEISDSLPKLGNHEEWPQSYQTKSKSFASDCFKNDLINVIGITTTSNPQISVCDEAPKELFIDYRVDFSIIDEISKSITPEILGVSKLANRFMFAGDYRQLPPQFELEPKILSEFRDYLSVNSTKLFSKSLKILGPLAVESEANDDDSFKKYLDGLFSNSMFTNLVHKMKNTSKENISYTALDTQYRFGSVLNDVVNLTYDEDEKLITGRKNADFVSYKMGEKVVTAKQFSIINTTILDDEIIEIFNKSKRLKNQINYGAESFDQKNSLITKSFFNSKANDYNALVIIKLLKNLLKRNTTLKNNQIGVIAMTRSQAMLINSLIKKEKDYNFAGIKVDTVDNFQGREKDIVILDLVRAAGIFENGKVIYPKNRNVDFYKSPERINVAASRAKSKLIVVGAIDYLSKNVISEIKNGEYDIKAIKLFNEWAKIAKTRGEIKTWKQF